MNAMKLIQKQLFKGKREFEIIEDSVHIGIKSGFSKEKLTIMLAKINPEPVLKGSELVFYDNFNSAPLFSLVADIPSAEEFGLFVAALRQGIREQSGSQETRTDAPGWNVYAEPPNFDDSSQPEKPGFKPVNAERVNEDITMLKTYLDERDIEPLLNKLEALKAAPHDEAVFQQVVEAYNALGFNQGAVLTYAPYLKVLLSRYIDYM